MAILPPDVLGSVISKLKADSKVSGVVSTRVTRNKLPANPTYPAIVASYVDDLGGGDSSTSNYAQARIQCSCYAADDFAAFQLSKYVKKSLHNLKNSVIYGSVINSIVDMGAVPDGNPDIPVYVYHRDFMVRYLDQ